MFYFKAALILACWAALVWADHDDKPSDQILNYFDDKFKALVKSNHPIRYDRLPVPSFSIDLRSAHVSLSNITLFKLLDDITMSKIGHRIDRCFDSNRKIKLTIAFNATIQFKFNATVTNYGFGTERGCQGRTNSANFNAEYVYERSTRSTKLLPVKVVDLNIAEKGILVTIQRPVLRPVLELARHRQIMSIAGDLSNALHKPIAQYYTLILSQLEQWEEDVGRLLAEIN